MVGPGALPLGTWESRSFHQGMSEYAANLSISDVPSGSWNFNADDELLSETYDENGECDFDRRQELHLRLRKSPGFDERERNVGEHHLRRLRQSRLEDGNGVTTQYLVEDDINPTGYPQVFDELNGAQSRALTPMACSGSTKNKSSFGTWTPSFYGYDGGGSVRQLTNSAGAVTDTYEYDAYGNSQIKTGTTPNNLPLSRRTIRLRPRPLLSARQILQPSHRQVHEQGSGGRSLPIPHRSISTFTLGR